MLSTQHWSIELALSIVIGILALVAISVAVFVSRDRSPSPLEAAVAYERAWDRFDFATLWTLSGTELRDGLTQAEFVASRRETYRAQPALRNVMQSVHAEPLTLDEDSLIVVTTLLDRDGTTSRNQLTMARRLGRWFVCGYTHAPDVGEVRATPVAETSTDQSAGRHSESDADTDVDGE
jgi:hypothetical protein